MMLLYKTAELNYLQQLGAAGQRVGLITPRSLDRNEELLLFNHPSHDSVDCHNKWPLSIPI
jgi:hypothetical protein